MTDKGRDIEALFNNARQIPGTVERAVFLNKACADDDALRARIEKLLAAEAKLGNFLASDETQEGPSGARGMSASAVATVASSPTEKPGTVIGRYKLLQQIGEGGFGVVYVAEQEQPVRRKVALKIIKLGMDTRQVIARFEAERQVLAMMDHPNIAKVLDAGATEIGRPYFVMELVKGIPITEYCNKQNMPLRERLALFMQVCGAVQHAHQKGIIHRDIKPSNVLVTHVDDKPATKVIDFGIAKATQARLTEQSMFTEIGQFIGTPAYMSPEQADPLGQDIDTRSDIYSLGVLLYELLTSATPFDMKTLCRAALDEIKRVIREEEPPRPSMRLSGLGAELDTVARQRAIEPKKLAMLLRGELDWIVMKAMEKDRQRRYETANGLGMDIQRYLTGEAVVAAPPSAAYRLKKFVRRNRGPVMAGLVLTLALVLGVIGTTWGMVSANRQRRVAGEARAQAEENARIALEQGDLAVQAFWDVVTKVDSKLRDQTGQDLRQLRQEVLTDAFNGLQRVVKTGEGPALLGRTQSAAYQRMGDLALDVGRLVEAIQYYEKCRDIAEALATSDSTNGVNLFNLGVVYEKLGDVSSQLGSNVSAKAYYEKSVEKRLASLQVPITVQSLSSEKIKGLVLGTMYRLSDLALMLGDPPGAWESLARYLELQDGRKYANPRDFLATIDRQESPSEAYSAHFLLTMGNVALGLDDLATSRALYDRCLDRSQADLEKSPKSMAAQDAMWRSLAALGDMHLFSGNRPAAIEHYEKSLAQTLALAQADPKKISRQQNLSLSYYRMATAHLFQGEQAVSRDYYRECLKIRQTMAEADPHNINSQVNLMLVLARCGQHAEAAALADKLSARAPEDPSLLFYRACGYSLCAAAMVLDKPTETLASDERTQYDRYVGQSLDALRQAVVHGFRDSVTLRVDPDLSLVRDHPAFGPLVESIRVH